MQDRAQTLSPDSQGSAFLSALYKSRLNEQLIAILARLDLPLTGWKLGQCGYCGEGSKEEPQLVHKLPNGLKACIACFRR